MEIFKLNSELVVPIGVGIILFFTDYIFGWLSFILGPFSMIFVVSAIIGYLVGNVEDAVFATILSIGIGVGICAVFTPFMFMIVLTSPEHILTLLMVTTAYASRGPLFFLTGFAFWEEGFILYVIFAPLQYFFAPGFSTIGAKISERLRKGTQKECNMPSPTTQETPMIHEN